MFNTQIDVVGQTYLVRRETSDAGEQSATFDSFEGLVEHLRNWLPIYPSLQRGIENA